MSAPSIPAEAKADFARYLAHLATSQHRGNVGIKTGSTARAAGKTHLFDKATGRTACGIARGSMVIHRNPYTIDELPARFACCGKCIAQATK